MPFLVDREKDTQIANSVEGWLAGQTIRGLTPIEVVHYRGEDASGEEAWYFVVRLPNPDPDAGTWPFETLNEFVRTFRDHALDEGLSSPWYVGFVPESDEEQEDEDQLELPGV